MSMSVNSSVYEPYQENHRFLSDSPFVVCAFFTSDSRELAHRANHLGLSCDKYQIPYSIYNVPSVHHSISENGGDDLTFTKANFINFNLDRFELKGVLYMDVDTFFVDRPDKLFHLQSRNCDLAIYNWLADKHNEAYVPVSLNNDSSDSNSVFFTFSHRIDY